jgi:hypothetical protein
MFMALLRSGGTGGMADGITCPVDQRSTAYSSKKIKSKMLRPSNSCLVMSSLGKSNVNCSSFQKKSTTETLKKSL